MTVETYLVLANCIKTSNYLTEIDLADNSMLDARVYVKMLKCISKNEKIRVLNFSHNKLMPEAWLETRKDYDSRQDLYPQERRIYKYLAKIMLNNNVMEHLQLTNCSLSTIMILKICNRAKKSKSLQAIHFSGNAGVNPYLLQRIHLLFEQDFDPKAAIATDVRQESFKPSEPVKLTYHKNLHSKRALENLEEDVRAKI